MDHSVNRHYINGAFVEGDNFRDVLNPATGEVLAQVPMADTDLVDQAVAAARAAQKEWAKVPAVERAAYLFPLAKLIREHADFLADTLVKEQGKVRGLAMVEVMFTADYLEYMAGWARRIKGEVIESDSKGERILMIRKPLGVVAGILPWNFPFFLIARKFAPAMVAGNTCVIKPSTDTPLNCFRFTELLDQIDLPKGVFNMFTAPGAVGGEHLAGHPDVDLVSMTGSVPVGAKIMEAASKNVTKVNLELGGKAPAIVHKDADLELAATAIFNSRVINSGQVCNCAERVYVHEDVAEAFTKLITEKMKGTKFGDPSQTDDLDMGPLINPGAVESMEKIVARAVEQGGEVVLGGKRVDGPGAFFEPTVIVGVKQDADIIQEETFGPILPIITYSDFDDAIAMANDSEFGLTSSLYTKDLDVAMKGIREIDFGETYINRHNFEAMQGFHAGTRKSGIGGADGEHGFYENTRTQVVYIQSHEGV